MVAAALICVAALPASAAPARCASAGKKFERNAHVRVWRVGSPADMEYRACWLTKPRRVMRLGDPLPFGPAPQGVSQVRLAGRYVAYEDWWCDRDGGCAAGVAVVDVRRAKFVTPSDVVDGRVVRLVLTQQAVAAWSIRNGSNVMIIAADRGGPRVLAQGSAIDTRSLALVDRQVYWLDDGQPRGQTL
jgi:hypothetical protein